MPPEHRRLNLRSPKEIRNFFQKAPEVHANRPGLDFYEQCLMHHGLIPKSFLERNAKDQTLLALALAELQRDAEIEIITIPGTGLEIIDPAPRRPPETRQGRYTIPLHPDKFVARGTRVAVQLKVLIRDRHLLYFMGSESPNRGIEVALNYVRSTMKRFLRMNPTIDIPEKYR
jgi:hypothetical protein